jgi:hypothetical protein
LLLPAGSFQDRATFAGKINAAVAQQDPLTTFLRYGTILNLTPLVNLITNSTVPNVGTTIYTYIYGLLYGSIANADFRSGAASQLTTTPTRNIDVFINSRLSASTISTLTTYKGATTATEPGLRNGAMKALLIDFANIVAGTNIYDPVRFAGVTVTGPTTGDSAVVNRGLLVNAYPIYTPGKLTAATAQGLSTYNPAANNATLIANILADFDRLASDSTLWTTSHPNPPFDQGLYNQPLFVGIPLSATTATMLATAQTGNNLTLLNQLLLQDAFAGSYQKAPLTPATVVAAQAFNTNTPATVTAFESAVIADLNTLINGGTSIYNATRFAPWVGAIDPSSELGILLTTNVLTSAQQLRENRLLLELAYNTFTSTFNPNGSVVLSPSVLASYRLVQVPAPAVSVSAKTAWNLRVLNSGLNSTSTTAHFVNDGVPGFTAADKYLRGGDITADNIVNLSDYNVLRLNFGATGPAAAPADIDGDSRVNINDYSLMKLNFGKSGDAEGQ